MIRNLLALLLVGAAVGLFVFLVFQSRPVSVEVQEQHEMVVGRVANSIEEYNSLMKSLADARQVGRRVGAGAQTALERLVATESALNNSVQGMAGGSAIEQELVNRFSLYSASVKQLTETAQNFILHQNVLERSVQDLRNESPEVVQELRAAGKRSMSQESFSLVMKVLDFARVNSNTDRDSLVAQWEALSGQDAPARLGALLYSVRTVIDERDRADVAWASLGQSLFSNHASQMLAVEEAVNRRRLAAVERYRLLLSVYSALLLLGMGFLGFRLYQSYRVLNETNAELEELNENLELRVSQRTEELGEAYENLKESQVQLVQAAKMSSLGQLVAGISHEINTPLLYLRSNATLIKERLEGIAEFVKQVEETLSLVRGAETDKRRFQEGLKKIHNLVSHAGIPEDVEDSVGLIQDSVEGLEQLSDMAQGLKDFSRLDRAPVAKYNVNDGLDKTLLIVKNALKRKVAVHKHYGDVPDITCAPSQINQIFLNLISNAAQAIEDTGDVVITTKAIDDLTISVSIADTGCGIPDEILTKIRDPFFTTKDVGVGTGLGLSIVEKIVSTHSGKLEIKSEVGKGSVFTVILPVNPPIEGSHDLVDESADAEPGKDAEEAVAIAG